MAARACSSSSYIILMSRQIISDSVLLMTKCFTSSSKGYASVSASAPAYASEAEAEAEEVKVCGHGKRSGAWTPDPVTGCYRPQHVHAKVLIDAAELRRTMLSRYQHHHHHLDLTN
ncbi:uncharacterized protein LOC127251519 [Andrographis paniculata]|uniref:uncharacterized protein LOC127251519 n=1 Tax=Andrographis paniculata TaxID=175694 RepID=UPI0021E7257F|nr:uncharacterized protein LOC127251519 [Andrographis paniculata]